MKVKIDPDLCTACGLCSDGVPEVFELGDTVAVVKNADVPPNLEAGVQGAADDCPSSAIIIEK